MKNLNNKTKSLRAIVSSGAFISGVLVFGIFGSANALPLADIEIGGGIGLDLRDGGYRNQAKTQGQASITSATFTNSSITNTKLTYGAYARAWIGPMIKIAPFISFDRAIGVSSADIAYSSGDVNYNLTSYQNIQYGLLLGIRVPLIGLTPYIGASYSKFFNSDLSNTYAINYGIKWELPIIPFLTIGLDGSYQNAKVTGSDKKANINRLQFTLGLTF